MTEGNKNKPGAWLQWSEEADENEAQLVGKRIKRVVWLLASHYSGGAPILRIVFEDDTFFEIDHDGDDMSSLRAEPYDPNEKHVTHIPEAS